MTSHDEEIPPTREGLETLRGLCKTTINRSYHGITVDAKYILQMISEIERLRAIIKTLEEKRGKV